jgi:hypothetical protein
MRRRHLIDDGKPLCTTFGDLDLTDDPTRVTCTFCIAILNGSDQIHRAAWQTTYARALTELRDRHRFEFDLIRLDLYPAMREEEAERAESYRRYLEEHPL